jgi:hypothetical protein
MTKLLEAEAQSIITSGHPEDLNKMANDLLILGSTRLEARVTSNPEQVRLNMILLTRQLAEARGRNLTAMAVLGLFACVTLLILTLIYLDVQKSREDYDRSLGAYVLLSDANWLKCKIVYDSTTRCPRLPDEYIDGREPKVEDYFAGYPPKLIQAKQEIDSAGKTRRVIDEARRSGRP